MKDTKVVIWDFDGVIADTFEMCLGLIRMGNPSLTAEEYRARFQGNINKVKSDKKDREGINFFQEYEKGILNQKLIEGIEEPIRILGTTRQSIIISSTVNKAIEKFLNHHNLRQYFKEILGNDVSPSKVEKLKMVLEKYNVSPEDCAFVTDTVGDIKEAEKAGIQCVAVTWGYQSKETLKESGPAAIVGTPFQILDAVDDIFDETWEAVNG